jgi:isopentenyl diphosphate isomerase/L-lactate dehydrogenase-like FMN-dependent dehydrogenase
LATADALPAIVAAVGHRAEIYVDGGVRSGASVLKALALGARAVLIGRPATIGLAADGAAGLANVLDLLAADLANALAICGARAIPDLRPDLVARNPAWPSSASP